MDTYDRCDSCRNLTYLRNGKCARCCPPTFADVKLYEMVEKLNVLTVKVDELTAKIDRLTSVVERKS